MKALKEKIVEAYRNGTTGYAIAKKFQLNYGKVYRLLKSAGVCCRSDSETHRRYEINENVFDNIDMEWKAYFLGLFYADGCLTKNAAIISLVASDREILEQLNKFIFLNRPLRETPARFFKGINGKTYLGKPKCILEIGNQCINKALRSHGLYERKTLTLKMPQTIPLSLMNHFFRGYFDGDGCIHNKKSWGQRFDFMGSDLFCNGASHFLQQHLNITTSVSKIGKVSRLSIYNKKDILYIYHYLYDNASIFLTRKYKVFAHIIQTTDWSRINKPTYSAHVGVTFDKRRGHWIANHKKNCKVTYLGAFLTESEAIEARKTYESRLLM